MLTLNDTLTADNTIVWVIKIELDSTTLRFATESLTLSGNNYSGIAVIKNSLEANNNYIDIHNGGAIAQLSEFSFELSKNAGYYFDDYYPTTSMPYLTARQIHVGFINNDSTTESDVTWFFYGVIDLYSYEPSGLSISAIEYSESEQIEIPFYTIQKEFDDAITYYPKMDEADAGKPVPIVYGDLSIYNAKYGLFALAPAIPTNPNTLEFIVGSHKMSDYSGYFIYKYISSVNSYVKCYRNSGSGGDVTYQHKFIIRLLDSSVGEVYGHWELQLRAISPDSNLSDITEITNKTDGDYTELDANGSGTKRVALRTIDKISNNEIGFLSTASADIKIAFDASSDSAAARGYTIKFMNNTLSSPTSSGTSSGSVTGTTATTITHSFGNSTTGKKDTIFPWTLDEITELDYYLINTETTAANKIRVYYAYLLLDNIRMLGLNSRRGIAKVKGKYARYIAQMVKEDRDNG